MTQLMQAAYWTGTEEIAIRQVDIPAANAEVRIKVAYGGICGTDMMIYLGKHPRARTPLIMCHEFSGIIDEDPGEQFTPGTPVVVNPLLMCGECYACLNGLPHICAKLGLIGIDRDGGFAEYVVVPHSTVRPIPATLPLIEAALIEPLAVAVHAVRVSDLAVGDETVILGAGPIGMMTAQLARLAGARKVWMSERSPRRIQIARDLGFEVLDSSQVDVVQELLAATSNTGFPVVFETAGVQATINDTCRLARPGGQILQVGMPKTPPVVDYTQLLFREVRVTPIRVYRQEDFNLAIALAAGGKLDLSKPVTHVLPLSALHEAMELAHQADDACKILLSAGR
jgi:(R,R)-butanediol dehydrogenase / meso-butanediol dehydrogenase / diacetyl reductase